MDEIYIKLHKAKELAELLKSLGEKIFSLPITAELCSQLLNDIDDIKRILKEAELEVKDDKETTTLAT